MTPQPTRYFFIQDGERVCVAAWHMRLGADCPALTVLESYQTGNPDADTATAGRRVSELNRAGRAGAHCPTVDRSPTVGGDICAAILD